MKSGKEIVKETLDSAIQVAQRQFDQAVEDARQRSGRVTTTPEGSPLAQHAHGALNALLDLRIELAGKGVIDL